MNNYNISPNYKGRYLANVVVDYNLHSLTLDEGTVLILEIIFNRRIFFQLKHDYTYVNDLMINSPMEILEGSAVDERGHLLSDYRRYCFSNDVRIPTDEELIWYEAQNVV